MMPKIFFTFDNLSEKIFKISQPRTGTEQMSHVNECEHTGAQLLLCSDETVAGLLERISAITFSRGYFGLNRKIQSYLRAKNSRLVDLSLAQYCTKDDIFLQIWDIANKNPKDENEKIYRQALRRACLANEVIHAKKQYINREEPCPSWLSKILSELIDNINSTKSDYNIFRERNKYSTQENSSLLTIEEIYAKQESIQAKSWSLERDLVLMLENRFLSSETLGNLLTRRHEFSEIQSDLWVVALQTITNRTTRIEFLDRHPAKDRQSVREMLELGPREEKEIEPVFDFIMSLRRTERLVGLQHFYFPFDESNNVSSGHYIYYPVSVSALEKWSTKTAIDILHGASRSKVSQKSDLLVFFIISIFGIRHRVAASGERLDRILKYAFSDEINLIDMTVALGLDEGLFLIAAMYNQAIIFDPEKRALLEWLLTDFRRWQSFSLGDWGGLVNIIYNEQIEKISEMGFDFYPNIGEAVRLAEASHKSKSFIAKLLFLISGDKTVSVGSINLLSIAKKIRRSIPNQ